ncbi:protein ERGIC-53-like isoform X2 [Fukomys damarensis]|uniref:protein ERGIC-53-like isoform X2 n=1 Tax=Fukomys damarensis TaxID=885580 RepID=UPI00053F4758|nr:protein ERGIC-53-like isoform X2 [Fukomys damarensis]
MVGQSQDVVRGTEAGGRRPSPPLERRSQGSAGGLPWVPWVSLPPVAGAQEQRQQLSWQGRVGLKIAQEEQDVCTGEGGTGQCQNPGTGSAQLLLPGPSPAPRHLRAPITLVPGCQLLLLTMLGVQGPTVLLCLLFLLLLEPYSAEGSPSLPRRRFEYKLSFKGPRLAWPGAGIPFWSHHGDAIPGPEEVRLAPSLRNCSGAMWGRTLVLFPAWEVEMQMRVTGPGHRGSQGMVMWYTQDRGLTGSVPGRLTSRDGVGIFFDSSSEDTQNSPAIRVLASDGHSSQEHLGNGGSRVLGSCHRDFRNRPYPFRARITYWRERLQAPPGPFLEMEQLRLARQLEGLRARLALGTRKDARPQPKSRTQEEGERPFDLQATLSRHSCILQALWGLSERLAQVKKQWKKQLGNTGWSRSEAGWDPAKVSTLLGGQQALLQALQEMRDVAAHMASEAQVISLPVGTEHHFLELDRILSLLHKDLQGLRKASEKHPWPPGWCPGTSACLWPGVFLLFLLIQTAGFFYYVNFRQELDKRLQKCWSLGSLPLGPASDVPRVLGPPRRQLFSPSMRE